MLLWTRPILKPLPNACTEGQDKQILHEWCNGVPFTSTRPLSAGETSALRRELFILRLKACTILTLFPIAFLIVLALLTSIEPINHGTEVPLSSVFILLLFTVVSGWVAVNGWEALRRASALKGDLK